MNVNDNSLLIDEGFFASLFQLPSKGISGFLVSSADIEDMQQKNFSSKTTIKLSDDKKEIEL